MQAAVKSFKGDANASGNVNLTDVIWTFLYLNGEAATICLDAADANDDGQVDLTDVLYSAEFLFRRGAPPAAPFPRRGEDPTEDPTADPTEEVRTLLRITLRILDHTFF